MRLPPLSLARRLALISGFCLVFACDRSEPFGSKPVLLAGPAPPHVPATPKAAPGLRSALRLATWNLRWLDDELERGAFPRSDRDYRKLAELATRLDADVIALQEVEGERGVARVFPADQYRLVLSARKAAQRTGFAVRHGIQVTHHPDLESLNVGHLRRGTDITVHHAGHNLRVLSVHLKSGCFAAALDRGKACRKLALQLPHLEAWIDARQGEGLAFAILGDFNRRFFATPDDPMWAELDDGAPQGLRLWSPTQSRPSLCKGGPQAAFIDHLVFNAASRKWVDESSFSELVPAPEDAAYRLSDHCPIAIRWTADDTAK